MTSQYDKYHSADIAVPEKGLVWNLYGAGEDQIGKDGSPESLPIPKPATNQMLVRVDSVGLCFSDVKIIRMGGSHPKLYNRDLSQEPTRLGHEASLTVIEVGESLKKQYQPGQRLAVQPDIYQDGKSTAYGYTIPGGLIQYHLIGPEMLDTDEGPCLLHVSESMGYAEASLLEPWGCVLAAYTQRRRLDPKTGGIMWIMGRLGDDREYLFSSGLGAPATIVMTDVPASVEKLVAQTSAKKIVRNGIGNDGYQALVDELTNGIGADMVVECTGQPGPAAEVLEIIRKNGRISYNGIYHDPVTLQLDKIVQWNLLITGPKAEGMLNLSRAIPLMADGRIDLKPLITHTFSLDEINSAFDTFTGRMGGAIKVIIKP